MKRYEFVFNVTVVKCCMNLCFCLVVWCAGLQLFSSFRLQRWSQKLSRGMRQVRDEMRRNEKMRSPNAK